MPYRIAGIDVHKKMLAVVVSDVEVVDEYQFERRLFGGSSSELCLLIKWLLEQEAEEVVMESTAQYWQPVGSTGAVPEADAPEAGRRRPNVGNAASGAGAVEPWAARAKEGFPRRRTHGSSGWWPMSWVLTGAHL